jgi:glycosyltransferase involved in cell wall biosynthesis
MNFEKKIYPRVSIIIICYNQKDFISEAIEGAIKQNYENLEIVISDDGSTDGTAEIIYQWKIRFPDNIIALINEDNVGITRNCNRALRACSGDFVALVGGDDVMLPGKVVAQVEWFKHDQSRVLCGHAIETILADGSKSPFAGPFKGSEGVGPESFIRRNGVLPAISVMVRKSAIPNHGFDETISIASDFLFWIEVLMTGGKYGYIEGVFAKYRSHDNNVTKQTLENFRDLECTYNIIAKRYPKYYKICETMIVKHAVYFAGVVHLWNSDKVKARERFIKAIKLKPLYLKAWIRLLQTI